MKIVDTYAFLRGSWELTRRLEDRRGGMDGTFRGRATLTEGDPDADSGSNLQGRYEETGDMVFGSRHTGPATRKLDVVRLSSGAVRLLFLDGRPFIDLDLDGGSCLRMHPCREDRYEISYVVHSHNVIEEHWHVRGPQTEYDAIATLTRVQ